MPKIIDHDQRRDEIAFAACKAVARWGFDRVTMTKIAEEAGYTTGMVAHYFETKQDIILAALRLISARMETRLSERMDDQDADLADILCEALPLDEARTLETTVWIGFWGHVWSDERIRAINLIVHDEWTDLIRKCVVSGWPEVATWPPDRQREVFRSVQLFLNGLTASAVTSPHDWSPDDQVHYLKSHLRRLRQTA